MAIRFVNDIDLLENEAKNLALHNNASDLAGTTEGLIYYNTGSDKIKYYNAAGWQFIASEAWVSANFSNNLGTVTSVALTAPSAFTVSGSPVTSSGTLAITGAGTTAQYIDGTGALQTFPTIPANIVETVTTTDGTFIDLTPNAATDGAVTVTADLSATGTASATTFLRGDNVWATPAGAYSFWTARADSGTADNIIDGDTVDIQGGTGVITSISTATTTATIDISLDYAGTDNFIDAATNLEGTAISTADTIIYHDATDSNIKKGLVSDLPFTNNTGDITRVNITAGNGLSGTSVDTTSGDHTQTLTVGAGTGIQVNASSVQIDYTGVDNFIDSATNLEGTAIATGDTIVYHDATDNNVKKGFVSDLPFNNYSFTVTADSGTNQGITNGNTLDIAGGTNISTVVGATDTVTVNLNDSITLSGTLTANGTGQHAFGGQVTIPLTPSANTDAASKGYVDSALAGSGSLIYQGGYNASTDTPSLDDGTPIAGIKKGWTYTVTADGLFFTEQVRVGDVLIAEIDSPTTLADWTTVQNNIDLASTSTVGIASFSSDNFAVSGAGVVTIKDNGIILGTETTGNYVADVNASAANNRLGIEVTGADAENSTKTVGLDIIGRTNLTTLAAGDDFLVYDLDTTTNKRVGADVIASYVESTLPDRVAYVILNSATSGVSSADAGGIRTWTVDVSVFLSGTIDNPGLKVEVLEVSSGDTVWAETSRSITTGDVDVKVKGTPAQGTYAVMLHYVADFGA